MNFLDISLELNLFIWITLQEATYIKIFNSLRSSDAIYHRYMILESEMSLELKVEHKSMIPFVMMHLMCAIKYPLINNEKVQILKKIFIWVGIYDILASLIYIYINYYSMMHYLYFLVRLLYYIISLLNCIGYLDYKYVIIVISQNQTDAVSTIKLYRYHMGALLKRRCFYLLL